MTVNKWGALASFLLGVSFVVAPYIYLTGNLQDANGPFMYGLADFLYGPVWAASLVTAVYALRERIGEHASRWMLLALLEGSGLAFSDVGEHELKGLEGRTRLYHLSGDHSISGSDAA